MTQNTETQAVLDMVTGIDISAFPNPDNVRIMTKQFMGVLADHAKSQEKDVSE